MTDPAPTPTKTMATEHTEGPWTFDAEIARIVSEPTSLCVAAIHVKGNPACEQAWPADARLIAAAPEMFEALKGFNVKPEWIINGGSDYLTLRIPLSVINAAAAALAKASGRSA